ncbi:hypothetical protein [Haloquadratum walsbyi]|jgi:Uncharacterized protein conserved in archaea|uniref:Uncharacterized protein conserved in archaea n=1 Tax=Haloquadratum walsbyi J07HQW2 TaxID=1238425 RepID=U1NA23_9EURY|nr:hypothetical protein [Haloquadratum walsbyi]ERG93680.1 MAG: uncharacterized protein conserved in archaea [Haloquadratum walsbyi J07HQW2]
MSSNYRSREVAKRVFARELREADHMFKEDDDEYAPSYLLLPSGNKANRLFLAGTLTEKERKDGFYSCRVTDSTGKFYIYSGQYQPKATEALRKINPPTYVAITGKPNTYETDDGNVITSIRPESVSEITEKTRSQWMKETAHQTLERLSAPTSTYASRAAEQYDEDSLDTVHQATIIALESIQTEL